MAEENDNNTPSQDDSKNNGGNDTATETPTKVSLTNDPAHASGSGAGGSSDYYSEYYYDGDVETTTNARAESSVEDMTSMDADADNSHPKDKTGAKKHNVDKFDSLLKHNVPLQSTVIHEGKRASNMATEGSFDFQKFVSFENEKKDREIMALKRSIDVSEEFHDDISDGLSHASLRSASGQSDLSDPGADLTPTPDPDLFVTSEFKVGGPTKHKRISSAVDIETGKQGGRRARVTMLAKPNEAQSNTTRRRKKVKKMGKRLINPFWGRERYDGDDDNSEASLGSKVSMHGRLKVAQSGGRQYRLTALGPKERLKDMIGNAIHLRQGLTIYEDTAVYNEEGGCASWGLRPNQWVIRYLHWAFRHGFLAVLLSGMLSFFALTMIFAVLILWIGLENPTCVHVNGVDFGTTGANFMDAYALSWTTFSTVGYGLIYPSTSSTTEFVKRCTGITILTTLESFVGILFASLCGAIVFAKVARAASFAQVQFSDPIVIKYGSGVFQDDESSDGEADGGGHNRGETFGSISFIPSKIPCPILEFRVLNRLHGQRGGEIIDATMNIVASIDEANAAKSLQNAVRGARRKGKKKKNVRKAHQSTASDMSFMGPTRKSLQQMKARVERIITTSKNQRLVEDPTGKFIPRRIFAKLDTDTQEHPFFKRLWMVRHVLDQNSPLLTQDAKELVRMNGGHWPTELNTAEGVRASLHFDQILVSLSGTSNVDANSVYAQKVYDYVDLIVGYRFCNVLFRDRDGSVAVDPTLLNDVLEQTGGGGENLEKKADTYTKDIFIL